MLFCEAVLSLKYNCCLWAILQLMSKLAGYGNIVPVTNGGRVLCVFFALLGAPLAIITIGDLGKFLSECTIWLYKKLKLFGEKCQLLWNWILRNVFKRPGKFSCLIEL